MIDLLPLALMWMWSQRDRAPSAVPHVPAPPRWPTASSPPPPIPAFTPNAPPAPTANTGTPLAELHAQPPAPAPARAAPKPKPKPKPSGLPAAVLRAAKGHVKLPLFGQLTKNATVSDIQAIVNTHGGALKRDGLYGPKTAAAWTALAKGKGLPNQISRVGPKVAKVAIQTFEQLSMPAIP